MSRTYAHVPARVELDRAAPDEVLPHRYGHWLRDAGHVPCTPEVCGGRVARWASAQPYSRRGVAVLERTSVVRGRLRAAAREYRTFGEVYSDVMPDPRTLCLCDSCAGW